MGEFGAFGKIPSLGDFFRIGVTPNFVEPWDNWLQNGMRVTRTILGNQWQTCFMSAPIWRFTLSAGQAGPDTVLGVMMPSVDRVGREFPLTLVARIMGKPSSLQIHFGAGSVFEKLENIALDTLEDGVSRDMLANRLQEMPHVPQVSWARVNRRPGQVSICTDKGQSPVSALAADLAGCDFRAPSVWSAVLESGSRLMTAEGLPTPEQIRGLFDLDAPVWCQPEQNGGQL